jgi:membrane-associated phospholipid phosphatase
MQPLQAVDTRAFLVVNCLPHPPVANLLADAVTIVTTGGWIWVLGLGLARVMDVSGSRGRLWIAAPAILGATFAVEQPIKALFRRRRPFIDIVRALVVGRRPDGWSFPSGHSAAAFSGAWVLSTIWPSRAPLFFTLAASVGFSRVYVGAHYPSDVISGAMSGLVIAEAIRRTVTRWLGWTRW